MNNCKKCGSLLNPGDVFCGTCGTQVSFGQNESNNMGRQINQNIQPTNNAVNQSMPNQQNQSVPNTQSIQEININNANQYMSNMQNLNMSNGMPNSNFIQNKANIDEILLDAYIGKNADKIKNTKFSFPFFFFSYIYAYYRKMWAFGTLILVLLIIVILSLSKFSFNLVTLLVLIFVLSFAFKNIYLSNARKKVQKIKTNNPNATPEQLITICQNKGGTTWVPVIIILVINWSLWILDFILGFIIIYIIFGGLSK